MDVFRRGRKHVSVDVTLRKSASIWKDSEKLDKLKVDKVKTFLGHVLVTSDLPPLSRTT